MPLRFGSSICTVVPCSVQSTQPVPPQVSTPRPAAQRRLAFALSLRCGLPGGTADLDVVAAVCGQVAPDEFPLFAAAALRGFAVELGAGDALLVPRWWWHQTSALSDGWAVNWWFETDKRTGLEAELQRRLEALQ